jgi:PAS domain S-box-containing protein
VDVFINRISCYVCFVCVDIIKEVFGFFKKNINIFFTSFIFLLIFVLLNTQSNTKLPDDFTYNAKISSIDNFFSEDAGVYLGEQYSVSEFNLGIKEVKDDVLILKNSFEVKTQTGDLIFAVDREYGINSKTMMHEPGFGDKDRNGYLFGPKNIKNKKSFEYWHINYDAPAKMEFVDSENILGLETYHYRTKYEDQVLDQTSNLTNLPGVPETRGVRLDTVLDIWIEPVTGYLIKYQDSSVANYYDIKTGEIIAPWNSFSNTLLEESVFEHVQIAQDQKLNKQLLGLYLPVILLIIWIVFIVNKIGLGKKLISVFSSVKFLRLMSVLIFTIATLLLFEWITGVRYLSGFFEGFSRTNYVTSINFMLVSFVLFMVTYKNKSNLNKIRKLSVYAILLGIVLSLSSIIFKADIIFFTDDILNSTSFARMSIFTSINFLLVYIASMYFFFIDTDKKYVFYLVSIFSLVLNSVALIGYIFTDLNIINNFLFSGAGPFTVVLFIILNITILFSIRFRFSKNNLIILLVLILSLVGTFSLGNYFDSLIRQKVQTNFNSESERIETAIQSRLSIYANTLSGGVGLFNASDFVSRDEWKIYVDSIDLQKNYPGIQGLGYAVVVEDENELTDKIRAEGFPEYNIRPESDEDLRTSIIYLEPFDFRNQRAFGYDMYSEQNRRNAMRSATLTGSSKISGKITLLQETEEGVQAGFLMYLPVYNSDSEIDDEISRFENIKGFVYAAFRMDDFIISSIDTDDISVSVFDGVVESEENSLYGFSSDTDSEYTRSSVVYVEGRPWTIRTYSNDGFARTVDENWLPILVTLAGVLITFLVTFVVYSLSYSRKRALDFAEEATKDLQKFKQAVDNATDQIVITDSEGIVIYGNHAVETTTGYTVEEAVGKKAASLWKEPQPKEYYEKMWKTIKIDKKPFVDVLQNRHKSGRVYDASVTIFPVLNEKKEISFFVSIERDITKEMEIDRAKSEFVSLASHQLRTPLSAIKWYSEMLINGDAGKINEDQKEYLSEIYKGNERMVDLVNALLNTSRLELGTFTIDSRELDPVKILEEEVKAQKHHVDSKKQKITVSTDKFEGVKADNKMLRIIFQNLVSNAVKYTPEKGKIDVFLKNKNEKDIEFTVKDSGYGIPKDQQDKIFTKLFRADNVRALDTTGTGLGLYIIKSIIEHVGGEISFESEKDKGTEFRVVFPKIMENKEGSTGLS